MKWHRIKAIWVTLVNTGLASIFTLLLFEVWTETPMLERVCIQGSQILVTAALLTGVALEFRKSRRAWKWNVAAQFAAALFPCMVFLLILNMARRSGVRIDGVEALLVWCGFWILVACGITFFLYSRSSMRVA
jgi:hypothetical protein